MPKNPGNTGHRGYKMSRIISIEPQGDKVAVRLECGHTYLHYPYSGYTAEKWAQRLQEGPGAFIIGKTRVRCHQKHE